jgi:hypothetical protein
MSSFEYRPKFVDIRASSSKKGAAPTDRAAKVERPCDYTGCKGGGSHRAPKGRDRANEYWWFCAEHVADYNRRWNYFSGMSDAELADFRKQEEVGHRPTWSFRAGKNDRVAAAARGFQGKPAVDTYGLFDAGDVSAAPVKRRKKLTRLQALALEVFSLDEDADSAQIRAKYAEAVKRWHPDSNGGDRGAETQLQRVVQAYQHLKAGGLV